MLNKFLLVLKSEINQDPLSVGYSSMSDEEIVESLNDQKIEEFKTHWITDRTLDLLFGLVRSLEIMTTLKTISESGNPLAARVEELLRDRAGAGIDIGNEISQESIGLFTQAGVFSAEEAEKVKALGLNFISRFEQLGFTTLINLKMIKAIKE